MALHSMTGFGRGEASDSQYTLTVEIKSVNHRYRDMRWRMSSLFSAIEIELKNLLTERFKRGSFDISINYKKNSELSRFDDLDENKITAFLEKMKKVSEVSQVEAHFSPTDFLRSEFYRDQDEQREQVMKELACKAFVNALDDLEKSRQSEGKKMIDVLKGHRKDFEGHFKQIESLTDEFQESVEQKLRKRFAEYSSEIAVEESRFMQEVVFYLEKLDVHEEINRIHGHLEKLDEILSSKREIGRQIDFLIQELNRETNTIGSKSSHSKVSELVVQMKVQLEKIREQGLNLE